MARSHARSLVLRWLSFKWNNRDVEVRGIDDAATLKLSPDPIGARARKDELELDTLAAVRQKRMSCIMSIRSLLAISRCPQTPRYFSRPNSPTARTRTWVRVVAVGCSGSVSSDTRRLVAVFPA